MHDARETYNGFVEEREAWLSMTIERSGVSFSSSGHFDLKELRDSPHCDEKHDRSKDVIEKRFVKRQGTANENADQTARHHDGNYVCERLPVHVGAAFDKKRVKENTI